IGARIIPVPRENDCFVLLITLRIVLAAFFVLLAPTPMRTRDIALLVPFVICASPTLHPFRIACIVRFFLLVEFGFIFLPIDFPPCNDFRAVASVISSGDCPCSFRITSSPRPHLLGVLSSSLFDSHLPNYSHIFTVAYFTRARFCLFALHAAIPIRDLTRFTAHGA